MHIYHLFAVVLIVINQSLLSPSVWACAVHSHSCCTCSCTGSSYICRIQSSCSHFSPAFSQAFCSPQFLTHVFSIDFLKLKFWCFSRGSSYLFFFLLSQPYPWDVIWWARFVTFILQHKALMENAALEVGLQDLMSSLFIKLKDHRWRKQTYGYLRGMEWEW